ncbi:DUF7563 family protein [Halobellus limi]|nr:hypothetical protein [Halobellus limi]QCC46593.1 hypothetical protein DV707_02290 [Halobellus limi]
MMDLSRGSSSGPSECLHCGSHVSRNFRRTFGDDEQRAHRCLACDSRPRVQQGSAAGRTVPYPDPEDQRERNKGPRVRAAERVANRGEDF